MKLIHGIQIRDRVKFRRFRKCFYYPNPLRFSAFINMAIINLEIKIREKILTLSQKEVSILFFACFSI